MNELKINFDEKKDKKVEELVTEKKVTEEKIEDSLNYDLLSKEEKEAIEEFNSKVDVFDNTQILQYGAAAQNKISKFSDKILEDVKTRDTGAVGDDLAALVAELKSFDKAIVDTESMNMFEKVFSNLKREVDKLIAKYSKVEKNVDSIEASLEKQKLRMLKDIALFDTMYQKNLDYFKEVSLYIIAGEKKLEELREVVLPELEKKAETSPMYKYVYQRYKTLMDEVY